MTSRLATPPRLIDENIKQAIPAMRPMTDEQLAQWLKAFLEEQRKQTKALNDLGCMVFSIAVVVVGMAALSFLGGLLASGLVR